MIVFPAVDIQKGKAVRLEKGQADKATVFNDDPLACAKHWENLGAKWLHLVDLDGAFQGEARSYTLIEKICSSLSIPVQLGGGIRDEKTARRYLDAGVRRLIIGTMAIEEPRRFASLCQTYPNQIGVSLDCDHGKLKTRGWVSESALTIDDVLPQITDAGSAFVIYTDISRDGMQTGINFKELESLSIRSKIPVLAAGGVATLSDIQMLYPLSQKANLEGVISGRALYVGSLDLREANTWIQNQKNHLSS